MAVLFAGTEKRVEEADLGPRFLLFQEEMALGVGVGVRLLAEQQGHKRYGA